MLKVLASGEFYGDRCLDTTLGNGLQIVENRYDPDSRVPAHAHESPYVALVLDGWFREIRRSRAEDVTQSTVFFHPAGEPHHEQHGHRQVRILSAQFTAAFLRRPEHRALVPDAPLAVTSAELSGLGRRTHAELLHDDALAPLAAEAYVLELLVALQRLTTDATAVPGWLRSVRDRLNDEFAKPPSLESLANDAGVHPAHVSRAFRRHFRCTLTEYVRKARIARAEKYLATGSISLAEVAALVGYSDQSHFSSAFKRERGISPARHRKRLRG